MSEWYVAYTQPMKEDLAAVNLMNQDFRVFIPRFKKTRKHARQTRTVFAPLFPRYIFLNFSSAERQWRSINGTIGVKNLICNGDIPLKVPSSLMDIMVSRTDEEGVMALSVPEFRKGQKLEITEGPFAGYEGLFECMDGAARVMLLLNIMGQYVRAHAPVCNVTAA